ncbi:MAG: hypothetical protein ACNA7O_12710 [Rhodobacterales bacterium]
MKHDKKTVFFPGLAHEIPADPILSFVSAHYDGLWHAARLLGGYESARLVDRCMTNLAQDRCVTQRTRVMLGQILAVLSLDKADDPDLPYNGYFAAIDPLDPVVEEICLLTDGLRHVLAREKVEPELRPFA